MKINFLKINGFGKLNNKEINLDDNINLIVGNNESGKTTLLKFITSMLYGVSKNKNGQEISDAEKYMPWNNNEFSGKIIYTLDSNKKIEVFRDFNKKQAKIYNENSEDISKEFNIDKTKGNEFFYEQTNIDEETFLSTGMVEQQGVVLDAKEKNVLIQKIANILLTGEDNLSYKKSIEKLNKKLIEEIGTERTSGKPKNIILEKIKNIKEEINLLKNNEEKIIEIKNKNNYLKNLIEEKNNKNILLNEIKKIKEKLNIENEKINLKNNMVDEYDEKINNIRGNRTEENSKKRLKKLLILIPIYLILIIINLFLFLKNIILIISLLIFLINLIYILFKNKKNNEKIKSEENEIKILEENKKEKIDEINNEKNNLDKIIDEEKNNLIKNNNKIISENEIEKLYNKDLFLIDDEIENCILEINNLRVEYKTNEYEEGKMAEDLGRKAEMAERLAELEENLLELKENEKIINLAKESLEESYNKMKSEATPKIASNLSQIAESISDGKYKNVKFNEEEGLIVELQTGEHINANRLSIGTIDQLYLSLRLAVAKEISKEKMPIILDESFAYYDTERLKNILKYLCEKFNDYQILIFSCTNREKEILEELGIKYNLVEI